MKGTSISVSKPRPVSTLALAAFLVLPFSLASPLTAGVDEWTPVAPEIFGGKAIRPIEISRQSPRMIYVGSFWRGPKPRAIYKSIDGGLTWSPADGEVEGLYVLGVDPLDPDTLYGSIEPGNSEIFRSRNGGDSWERVSTASRCLIPSWMAFGSPLAGVRPLYLSGPQAHVGCIHADTCALFKSVDAGAHWECVRGESSPNSSQLAVDPESGDVYASDFYVYRSSDQGETWQRLSLEPRNTREVVLDPLDPTVLYVIAGGRGEELWKSIDGGSSWSRIGDGLPRGNSLRELAVDPVAPERLYANVFQVGVFASDDGGASWSLLGQPLSEVVFLAVDPSHPATLYAGTRNGLFRLTRSLTAPCEPDATTLCLNGGRFEVRVAWSDFEGGFGPGLAVPVADDSGSFWFFAPDNTELVVKVLDGRVVNDHHWVFYASLSNVEYTMTVVDTETGEMKAYLNPAGRFASVGDTSAFPLPGGPASAPVMVATPSRNTVGSFTTAAATAACTPGGGTLCLNGGRFRVEVEWEDFTGGTGSGRAMPWTDDSGFFWFFAPDNVELVVKVLDGAAVNGHFWVFYGALSNVAYTLRVTDTATGQAQIYRNPAGRFASVGDTGAFPQGDGQVCGTIAGLTCPEGQACDLEHGSCQVSDAAGICVPLPEVCPEIFDPVCGCDGVTYDNDCFRLKAHVTKDHDGPCAGSETARR